MTSPPHRHQTLRIAVLGLGPKTTSLLEAGMSPREVAATLNAEEEDGALKESISPITTRDVRDYKDFMDTLETQEINALVEGSAKEKRLAARLNQRIEKTLELLESLEGVAIEIRNDFEEGRDKWKLGPWEDNNGKIHIPTYPTKQVNLLVKIIAENRQVIRDLHQDKGIQGFIRSATVTVNQQGIPLREVYAILREMARLLDLPMDKVMSAFTEAQDLLATKNRPIDVGG